MDDLLSRRCSMIARPRYLLLTYRYMEASNLCRIEEKTTILDDEGRELDFFG